MKVRKYRKGQQGFTLIELLVVVAIIALLAAVAVPKLFDAINKAKTGKSAADLDTISSALERNYFDLNQYPGTAFDAALKGAAYLKAGTTFQNGFNKGYLYQTNTAGGYYVMADPGNNTGTVQIVCGVPGTTWNSNPFTIDTTPQTNNGMTTAPTAAQVAAGCTLNASNAGVPGAVLSGAKVVTN